LFIAAYLLIAFSFFVIGVCLLLSPRTYFVWLDGQAQTDFWSKRSSNWDPEAQRWRALGAAGISFALFMVFGPLLNAYLHSPESVQQKAREHASSSHSGISWGAIVVLLFFFAVGLGFLAKPLAVLDKFSPRKLSSEPAVQGYQFPLRILGIFVVVVSVLGISVQLLRHFVK
jgi:hypothetical protein